MRLSFLRSAFWHASLNCQVLIFFYLPLLTPISKVAPDSNPIPCRELRGSIVLSCRTDSGEIVKICYVVVEGSSQRIITKRFPRRCNQLHINDNCVQLSIVAGKKGYIFLVNNCTHSFIWFGRFLQNSEDHFGPILTLTGYKVAATDAQDDDLAAAADDECLSCPFFEVSRTIKPMHDNVWGTQNLATWERFLKTMFVVL